MLSAVMTATFAWGFLGMADVAEKPAAEPEMHAIETRLLERTNHERVRRGLRPLKIDRGLLSTARRHAAWMTRSRRLTHTSRPVAENIAMGQSNTAEVVGDWMRSTGHRANILNPNHTRIGVAAYRTPSGTVYWCQQFH